MGHLGTVSLRILSVVNQAACADATSDDIINATSEEMINKAAAIMSVKKLSMPATQLLEPFLVLAKCRSRGYS